MKSRARWTSPLALIAGVAVTAAILGPFAGAASAFNPTPSATPPSAPRNVVAVAGDGEATISWEAPESDGGSPIWLYTVLPNPLDNFCETETGTSCTITGLKNGTTYTAVVYATNDFDDGPPSMSVEFTPTASATAPGAPRTVMATAGDGSGLITWTAPESDGGSPITGYTATASPGGEFCETETGTSCTIAGLTNGTPYTATVTATNAVGPGLGATSNEFTPSGPIGTVPGKVRNLEAEEGNKRKIDVEWREPSDTGGSAITGYRYRWGAAKGDFGKWQSVKRTRVTLEYDRGRTRVFRIEVQARNVVGFGPSARVTVTVKI